MTWCERSYLLQNIITHISKVPWIGGAKIKPANVSIRWPGRIVEYLRFDDPMECYNSLPWNFKGYSTPRESLYRFEGIKRPKSLPFWRDKKTLLDETIAIPNIVGSCQTTSNISTARSAHCKLSQETEHEQPQIFWTEAQPYTLPIQSIGTNCSVQWRSFKTVNLTLRCYCSL